MTTFFPDFRAFDFRPGRLPTFSLPSGLRMLTLRVKTDLVTRGRRPKDTTETTSVVNVLLQPGPEVFECSVVGPIASPKSGPSSSFLLGEPTTERPSSVENTGMEGKNDNSRNFNNSAGVATLPSIAGRISCSCRKVALLGKSESLISLNTLSKSTLPPLISTGFPFISKCIKSGSRPSPAMFWS